ncbi:MAG: hypothetical protein RLZZ15_1303 [Verrucomicrobiota bacterium]|jgi:uncharacterized lipoprotein YbaY
MKNRLALPSLLALALLALAGCGTGTLELARSGDPSRVVTGSVIFRPESPLPADTEIVVTLVDASSVAQTRAAAKSDLPGGARAQVVLPPTQLGQQTLTATAAGSVVPPVPFRIEFQASDELLRHGLNLEARVSFGGRVRYRLVNAHLVTKNNLTTDHELWVSTVR